MGAQAFICLISEPRRFKTDLETCTPETMPKMWEETNLDKYLPKKVGIEPINTEMK